MVKTWSYALLGGVRLRVRRCTMVWGLAGWRWVRPPVAQLSEYPQADPTGLLSFLCGLAFGFVAASHVNIPAMPLTARMASYIRGPEHATLMVVPQ